MCGIVGAVGSMAEITTERFAAARDLMIHRGPDDAGAWQDGTARLGSRRLAILDLSPAGHQPMASEDGCYALTFNGEIYNYRELRAELEGRFRFRSHSDTEVLLHGFVAWGWERLLARIDGMFAFALWDAAERRLYAARDRVGKKPFFYAHAGTRLRFASTINALLALLPATPEVEARALDSYLVYQAVPAPLCIFRGFAQLPPAHQMVFDAPLGRLTVSRYWDLPFRPKLALAEPELLDALEERLRVAVRRRLISDVPLGAFLSGGVDSGLVVALMAQEGAGPVEAVCLGFADPRYDERPYARQVAARWGVRLHERELAPDALAELPEVVWHYGQPLADVSIVPTYAVARAAREHVTVVLNGDGGDELFGGYARPLVERAAAYYRDLIPGPLRRGAAALLADRDRGWMRKGALLARAGRSGAAEAFTYDRAFRPWREAAYTDEFRARLGAWHPDWLYRAAWEGADAADDVDRALYGDFSTYLPDQLLAKMDVATMAHSLEARAPLLDRELIEFAARIPTTLRLRGWRTKHLLKRLAARYLPPEVVYRRKRGFVMPAGEWLRGPLAGTLREFLAAPACVDLGWLRREFVARMVGEHLAGRRDWGEQLWTLLVLELWLQLAVTGKLQRSDRLLLAGAGR